MEFDRACLNKDVIIDDLDELKEPFSRFFHELIAIAFDVYSSLLKTIHSVCSLFHETSHNPSTAIWPDIDSICFGTEAISNVTDLFLWFGWCWLPSFSPFVVGLTDLYNTMKQNMIPEALIEKIISNIFNYVDAQLFNALLKKPALYTCKTGFAIKMSVSQGEPSSILHGSKTENVAVESAVSKVGKLVSGLARSLPSLVILLTFEWSNGMNNTKEAANLLVMDKSIFSDDEIGLLGRRWRTILTFCSEPNLPTSEFSPTQLLSQLFQTGRVFIHSIPFFVGIWRFCRLAPDPIPDSIKRMLEDRAKKSASKNQTLELNTTQVKKTNVLALQL